MQGRRAFVLGCAGLLISIAVSAPHAAGPALSKSEAAKQIRFGSDMARQGNWHEAIFRWQRALAAEPDNPRIHNNLAVAYESIGAYDKADAEYRAAAALPDAPEEIARNRDLFHKFYSRYKEAAPANPDATPGATPPAPPPPPAAAQTEKPAAPKEPDAKAP